MRRPPRSARDRLIDWPLLARSYLFLGPLEAVAAMAAFFFVLAGGGWHYGQPLAPGDPLALRATTACLSAIVVMQLANFFLCRSERASAFACGALRNPLLWTAVLTECLLILAIDYTAPGHQLFGTAPLPAGVWLFLLPFAAAMLALEEGRKWLANRLGHRTPRSIFWALPARTLHEFSGARADTTGRPAECGPSSLTGSVRPCGPAPPRPGSGPAP